MFKYFKLIRGERKAVGNAKRKGVRGRQAEPFSKVRAYT